MRKLPKLGKAIEGHEERDAIHVAIIPAKLLTEAHPGQRVRLVDRKPGEKFYTVAATRKNQKCIGVVDPYIDRYLEVGETVWILLKPNTVTDMRHHWEHPEFEDFVDEDDAGAEETFRYLKHGHSIEWLRNFAAEIDMTYSELIRDLQAFQDGHIDSIHLSVDTPYDQLEEMWKHYENVTGTKTRAGARRDQPFTCGC